MPDPIDLQTFLRLRLHRGLFPAPDSEFTEDRLRWIAEEMDFHRKGLERLDAELQSLAPIGFEIGDRCNRDGCPGVLEEGEHPGNCSCHICPPCSACMEPREYCPECDWHAKYE